MDPQNSSNSDNNQDVASITPITTSSGTISVQNAPETQPGSANPLPSQELKNNSVLDSTQNSSNDSNNFANQPQNEPIESPQQSTQTNLPPIDSSKHLNPFVEKPNAISKFKKIIIPIIILLIILVLAGFLFYFFKNKTTREVGTITMWGFEDPVIWQPILDNFQSETKLKVSYTQVSQNNYETTLLESFAEQTTPDIFPLRSDWFTKHSNKITQSSNKVSIPEYYTYAKSILSDNDKYKGITISQDSLALFYNKDLVGSLNSTDMQYWDQIKTWASANTIKQVNNITTASIPMGTGSNINYSADILSALLMQNNATMSDTSDNFVQYDQVIQKTGVGDYYPGKEGLEFFTTFAQANQSNYSWNSAMPNSLEAFGSGKVKTYLGYAQDISVLKNKYPLLNYDVLPLPQIRNSEKNFSIAQFWSLSVSRDSARPNNSWKLLEYITKTDNINRLDLALKLPSPYPSVSASTNNTSIKIFEEQAKTSGNWVKFDQTKLDAYLLTAADDVVSNNQNSKIAIEAAAKKTNDFIKTRSDQQTKASGNNKTVRIWMLDSENKGMRAEINNYAKKNTDYQFIISIISSDQLETRYLEDTASKIGPDLLFIPEDQLPRWKKRLSSFFNPTEKIKYLKDNFYAFAYANNIFDNKLYGISLSKNILVLASNNKYIRYDKRVTETPQTWGQLIEQVKTLTTKNNNNIEVAGVNLGANTTNASDILTLMMLQYKAQLTNPEKTQTAFYLPDQTTNEYNAQKALDLYRSFNNPASENYSWNDSLGDDIELFRQGKLAYLILYQTDVEKLKTDKLDFEVTYSPIPQVSLDDTPIDIAKNTDAVISKSATNHSVAANILWYTINNFSNYSSEVKTNTKKQKSNQTRDAIKAPFTSLGENAINIYKGGEPTVFNNTIGQLISSSITLEQAGETINKSWEYLK